MLQDKKTHWNWTPDWSAEDQSQPRIVLFRRACLISDSDHAHGDIRITADTHYKLYVNGAFANFLIT